MKTRKSVLLLRLATYILNLGSIGLVAIVIVSLAIEARGDDFRVSDEDLVSTTGDQSFPDVAASEGGYTVVWRDEPSPGQVQIQAQLYDSRGLTEGFVITINDD